MLIIIYMPSSFQGTLEIGWQVKKTLAKILFFSSSLAKNSELIASNDFLLSSCQNSPFFVCCHCFFLYRDSPFHLVSRSLRGWNPEVAFSSAWSAQWRSACNRTNFYFFLRLRLRRWTSPAGVAVRAIRVVRSHRKIMELLQQSGQGDVLDGGRKKLVPTACILNLWGNFNVHQELLRIGPKEYIESLKN